MSSPAELSVISMTPSSPAGLVALVTVVCLWAVASCSREGQSEALAPPPATPPATPNVILISIDTLRPDHLGCYGYKRNTSPRIDRLAAEGVLFENTISSTSWTLPAHAALFSSLADTVHGCTDTDKRLHADIVTLAERFADAGYQTVGFFSGPYLHPVFGLGQGFAEYVNCTSYARALDDARTAAWANDLKVMRQSHRDVTNPTVYEAVRRWMNANGQSRPFFMFIHLWDVHFDFIPPPPYDTMFDPNYQGPVTGRDFFFDSRINARMPRRDLEHLLALYDGEIAWTDLHVGRIVDDLKRGGLLDKTVLAVTSDHGTEFFEHGYKAHRMTLFDEVIRIPLIIRYPASLPAGRRIRPQVRIIDVGPTLLELAGVEPPTEVTGQSLVPLTRQATPDFDNLAVSELFSVGRRLRTIRTLEWKFADHLAARKQYYIDLTEDPGERHPLTDLTSDPGRQYLARYRAVLENLTDRRAGMPDAGGDSALPDDVRRQLENLGYVSDDERQK